MAQSRFYSKPDLLEYRLSRYPSRGYLVAYFHSCFIFLRYFSPSFHEKGHTEGSEAVIQSKHTLEIPGDARRWWTQ